MITKMTRWRLLALLSFSLAVAIPASIIATYIPSFGDKPADGPPVAESMMSPGYSTPFLAAGINNPPIVPASQAGLPDDELIIGVEMNGRARAYRVSALRGPMSHVVNDVIDHSPVTVTYCDIRDCARGFTGKKRDTPLDVSLAGLHDGDLLLKTGDTMFSQSTGEGLRNDGTTFAPLESHPIVRTTWKAWRDSHPSTDVYLGPQTRP